MSQKGEIFVLSNGHVDIFYGEELRRTFELKISGSGIAVDRFGNDIWVVSRGDAKVRKYRSDGQLLAEWESGGDKFRDAWGIAVDNSRDKQVYVPDRRNNCVQVFSPDGIWLAKWGTTGTGDGQFDHPIDAAVDAAGNVYILEKNNARVQVFSHEGEFLGQWGSIGTDEGQFLDPYGIAIDLDGYIYVLDSGNFRVQVFKVSTAQ